MLIAPTARAGGQNTLQMATSLAYPVGDVILVVGVASLLLRGVPAGARRALSLIAGALCLFVIGDSLYAYATLHSVFANSDALNVTYAVALALFVLAARCQRSVTPGAVGASRRRRVSWMPYVAVAAGFIVPPCLGALRDVRYAGDRSSGNGPGGPGVRATAAQPA